MPKAGGTDTVIRTVVLPAVSYHERMGSPMVNLWMELLEVYPVDISSGQTPTQVSEWIPPLETIEKRLEKVLVLSNKSFPRSVALRQVTTKIRNWALRYGKDRAVKLAIERFGGIGE
jgi:hypothetical protein